MAAYTQSKDGAASINGASAARDAVAVTPHDSNDLTAYPRAVFVGGAGNVSVIPATQQGAEVAVVFKGLAAGSLLPVQVRRINATGTTATDIVALI